MPSLNLSWLNSVSARERRVLLIGGAIAVILFVLAVIVPLDQSVATLHQSVAHKQADLAWMRRVAPELAAAGPAPHAASEPLIVLVNESAREAGLGGALAGSAPSGDKNLQVQLREAPFDTLIAWLGQLRRQGVKVESATIDEAGKPGQVNASLQLKQP